MKYVRPLLPLSAALYLACFAAASLPCLAQAPLLEDPGTRANKLIQEGKYKECLDYLEPLALGGESRTPVVQFYYARCLARSGREKEAAEHYQMVLKLHPFGWLESYSKRGLEEIQRTEDIKAGRIVTSGRRGFKSGVGYIGCKLSDRKVQFVYPQSPAASANLTAGDMIVAVDGKDCRSMDKGDVAGLLTGPVGSTVSVRIERGGKQYEIKIVRADMTSAPVEPRPARMSGTTGSAGNAGSAGNSINTSLDSAKYVPTGAKLLASDPQITIFRHTADSDEMKDILVNAILRLPRSLRSEVASAGIGLILAPTVLEAMPEMATETPRGYIHGGGFTNCGGLFSPKHSSIYVGERVSQLSSVPHLNIHLEHTLFHEFGHAIDSCRHLSHSAGFMSAYNEDCGHLTNGLRTQFHYFTQEGQAGPSELFAELFSDNVKKQNELTTHDINLTRTFPNCFKYVGNQLPTNSEL